MKKYLVLLLIAVTASLQAQRWEKPSANPILSEPGNWTFAPKIGLNLANITNTDMNVRPGMNVGVTAEYRFTPVFALEGGVFYSMQGSKKSVDIAGDGYDVTIKFKNDYLNIPVLAKAYIKNGWNVFAGPQLGFRVSSKISGKVSDGSADANAGFLYRPVDFSLVFGTGYQFDWGLLISANYNIGLTDMFKNHAEYDGETLYMNSSRNSVFQLNVGWRF